MTSECPYIPHCTSYTPCCQICKKEPGPYCGKWREFDTALQLKKEKAGRRAQFKKAVYVRLLSGYYLFAAVVVAFFMNYASPMWAFADAFTCGVFLTLFIISIGEWTK
jgi:hypothetical protein